MARYADAPDSSALYVWDMRLQKAFLEDIAHVEVLLRNFIANRLATDCMREEGDRAWYDHPDRYGMNDGTRNSIAKAKSRLAHEGKVVTYDRVIAALTFDTWSYLGVTCWFDVTSLPSGAFCATREMAGCPIIRARAALISKGA